MHERPASRSAFTLIEVMIAVTILGMVMALVWGGFDQTYRTKTRVEAATDRNHAVASALGRMIRDLQMAYVSAQVNPTASRQLMKTCFIGEDRGRRDRIDFTSFSHQRLYRDTHESDQAELSYFITEDRQGRQVLARREQARPDEDPRRGGEILVLLHDVESFELEYLDPISMEWLETWDTTQAASQPNRMPAQVRLSVGVRTPDGRVERFGTRVVIPIRYALNHATYTP